MSKYAKMFVLFRSQKSLRTRWLTLEKLEIAWKQESSFSRKYVFSGEKSYLYVEESDTNTNPRNLEAQILVSISPI